MVWVGPPLSWRPAGSSPAGVSGRSLSAVVKPQYPSSSRLEPRSVKAVGRTTVAGAGAVGQDGGADGGRAGVVELGPGVPAARGTASGQAVAGDGVVGHGGAAAGCRRRRRRTQQKAMQPDVGLVVGHGAVVEGQGAARLVVDAATAWDRSRRHSCCRPCCPTRCWRRRWPRRCCRCRPLRPRSYRSSWTRERCWSCYPRRCVSVTVRVPPAMFSMPPPDAPQPVGTAGVGAVVGDGGIGDGQGAGGVVLDTAAGGAAAARNRR